MKKTIFIMAALLSALIPFLLGMSSSTKMTDARVKRKVIQVEVNPSLEIHEGYVSQKAETILVKQGRKTIAQVNLSEPVMVAMAEQEEKWGYFQFPSIGIAEQETFIVSWQMNADSHRAYGTISGREPVPMMSKDSGKTWQPRDKNYNRFVIGNNVRMSDDRVLQIKTPKSIDIHNYDVFPKAISVVGKASYYLMDDLPEELQGVYMQYENPDNTIESFHATINDPGLLRSTTDSKMPVIWLGNIKKLNDETLVAGTYPTYYLDSNGSVLPGSVSFYESYDKGKKWERVGVIPLIKDGIAEKGSDKGFVEPAFEVLDDETYICVMRTGSTNPMYKSFSYDRGRTWTQPVPFTPNGVKPKLVLLENGILVLFSGRPGAQLRFSLDGTGDEWTEPIDLIPYMKENGSYIRDVSCGYVSYIVMNNNTIYIVYSDFTTNNDKGENRKSIWGRRISVIKN